VLLGVDLAARRADSAGVIAAAIEAKAAGGAGHRQIASRLGRPASTVRGWLRGFTASAAVMTDAFRTLLQRDAADAAALWPAPAATVAGQALAVLAAYARALGDRLGIVTPPWQAAGLAAAGPWFFSSSRWAPGVQHELAPAAGVSLR
jgi:hypothetical protein